MDGDVSGSDDDEKEVEVDGDEGDADFSDATLNNSSKNIRSKVAASSDYFAANSTESNSIKADFDGWLGAQVTEVFPNWSSDAVAGSAGMIQESVEVLSVM